MEKYTPLPAWTFVKQASGPAKQQTAVSMLRFLIDHLAFTYNVNLNELRLVLLGTPVASTYDAKCGEYSILSQYDRNNIVELATIVAQTSRKIERQHNSSIRERDFKYIYDNVIIPAKEINVQPGVILSILNDYLDHRSNPWKRFRAGLQATDRQWRNPFSWLIWLNKRRLAIQLVSDDVLNGLVAPNEDTRILIGSAIARTSNRYLWFWSDMLTIGRGLYSGCEAQRLVEEACNAGKLNALIE